MTFFRLHGTGCSLNRSVCGRNRSVCGLDVLLFEQDPGQKESDSRSHQDDQRILDGIVRRDQIAEQACDAIGGCPDSGNACHQSATCASDASCDKAFEKPQVHSKDCRFRDSQKRGQGGGQRQRF